MRTQRHLWLGWLPALVWMALIFAGSTDTLSAAHTSRFIEPFLRWLFRGTLQPSTVDLVHFLIRKIGHVSEYAVLAALFWNALRLSALSSTTAPSRLDHRRTFAMAIFATAIYAAGDEFHQSFVPSRGPSVGDVLIDVAGGTTGLLLLQAGRQITRRWVPEPHWPDKS